MSKRNLWHSRAPSQPMINSCLRAALLGASREVGRGQCRRPASPPNVCALELFFSAKRSRGLPLTFPSPMFASSFWVLRAAVQLRRLRRRIVSKQGNPPFTSPRFDAF